MTKTSRRFGTILVGILPAAALVAACGGRNGVELIPLVGGAGEEAFFAAIRKRVTQGELSVHYVLGNHDRLLRHAPRARRAVWKALTGQDIDIDFPEEKHFPDHRVLAYHGHRSDAVNYHPEGAGTIGDAIGSELIVGFPRAVRAVTGGAHPELDDIDDVRPIYAVPAWVRHFGTFHPELLGTIHQTWGQLVENFFDGSFVSAWFRREHRRPE